MIQQYWWVLWVLGLIFIVLIIRAFKRHYIESDDEEKQKLKRIYIGLAIISVILFTSIYFTTHKIPAEPETSMIEDIIQTQDE